MSSSSRSRSRREVQGATSSWSCRPLTLRVIGTGPGNVVGPLALGLTLFSRGAGWASNGWRISMFRSCQCIAARMRLASGAGGEELDRNLRRSRTKQEHFCGTVRCRMSRRYLSLWLSAWPLERMRLKARRQRRPFPPDEAPLALVAPERGVPLLTAVNPAGRALGVTPGLPLADARAICPGLLVQDAEPVADAEELATLGLWCTRYSPKVMLDGTDGLVVDITGCSHLFGGERSLVAHLEQRLKRLGLTHRLAVAGRLAQGWAWARFGAVGLALGAEEGGLALPVAGLRLGGGPPQGP